MAAHAEDDLIGRFEIKLGNLRNRTDRKSAMEPQAGVSLWTQVLRLTRSPAHTREPVGVTGQYGAASDSTSWTIRNISTPKNQTNTHKHKMLLEIINIINSCQHGRSAFLSQISNNCRHLRMVFEFDCYFYIIFSRLNNDLAVLIYKWDWSL